MLRFPFNPRPAPRRVEPQQQPNEQLQEEPNTQAEKSTLSPELNFLLSMTMKDGLKENNMLSMLRDILPYISSEDNNAVRSILDSRALPQTNRPATTDGRQNRPNAKLSQYSKQNSQQELLEVMQRYAGQDTGDMMNQMQGSNKMQNDFENMAKSMGKMQNMQNASMEDMMQMMSTFMPNQDMSQFNNMQSMMNMMKMMGGNGNLKPEDMMKFMNMNKQQ